MDAHRATQADLSAMAKARAQFLAEFGIDPISGKAPEEPAKPQEAPAAPEEPAEPVPATVEELLGVKPVTSRDTMLSEINDNIHTKAVNREDVLKGLEDTRRISKEELKAAPVIPAEELEAERTKTIDDLLEELTMPIQKPAQKSELGAVMFGEGEEPAPQEAPAEAAAVEPEPVVPEPTAVEPEPTVQVPDMFAPETVEPELAVPAPDVVVPEPVEPEQAAEQVTEGFAAKEEPTIMPDDAVLEGLKPGLDDTIVMTGIKEPEFAPESMGADESFADYGEKEAQQLRELQEAQANAGAFAQDVSVPEVEMPAAPEVPAVEVPDVPGAELPETPEEVPEAVAAAAGAAAAGAIATTDPRSAAKAAKEAKKAEKAAAKEAKKAAKRAEEQEKPAGGAGRTILKILLIILIIIFIIELAGIGIKWLAPDSGAAQFIDNQLNNVIQLITGSTPDYEIPGIDYEV